MKHLVFLVVVVLAATPALAAEHPGPGARCGDCHTVAKGPAGAPKVIPEAPGFFAKLFGEKSLQGHPTVACVGQAKADGTVTGCHDPGNGREGFLVVDMEKRPADEFCGSCHPGLREPGAHHPSYKADKDEDGVPETIVRPAAGQDVYLAYAGSERAEPLRTYPDAMVFRTTREGVRDLDVVLPLQSVVELVEGEEVVEAAVVTCTSCHNPHYGYLAGVGSEEELNREQVAREKGDALLRLRDHDNSLCEACH